MALPGLFPIYPNPIPMLYQVSLSLPPLPTSEISKAIGITASAGFLVPNIDFLKSFAQGNLGIADKMTKETLYRNFNHPIAQGNEKVIKSYASNNGIDIPDFAKYKVDGKIKFPKEDVTVPDMGDIGLKAFEKTIMTSIFETQKPYLEVAKLVIGNVAKIEDIIARVMPLLGVPLTTKSLKPVGNNGVPNGRPKAIGYQNGADLKKALSKLKTLSNDGSKVKIDKNGNAKRDVTPTGDSSVSGSTGDSSINTSDSNWEVISTVYSTGKYIPGVKYQYTYIDLPVKKTKADENEDLNLGDDDPYNKYKPERIILGIFRADGTPLNPNEKLTTIGLNGNNIVYNNTPFSRADWILRSPKWNLPPYLSDTRSAIYAWPAFGTPIYKWVKNLVFTENSKTSPGDGWEIKKYKEGDTNILTNEPAFKDDPIIVGFETNQVNEYKSYFTDTVRYKMNQVEDLEQSEKDKSTNDIINQLNISSHLQNVFLYGQSKSSVYKPVNNKPAFPDKLKIAFKPFQIYSANAEKDEKLAAYNKAYGQQPGFIWIDPESDYETKVIRVDPTTKIAFEDAKGAPQVSSTIKSFVKNKARFSISTGEIFNLEMKKNNQQVQSFNDINEYVLENWNYNSDIGLAPESRVQNNNRYNISIWSKIPVRKYKDIGGTLIIKKELTGSNISDFNGSSNLPSNLLIHELVNSGTSFYYKKYKWLVDIKKVKIIQLLNNNNSNLLNDMYNRFEKNPNDTQNFTVKVGDIINYNNLGVISVGSGLFFGTPLQGLRLLSVDKITNRSTSRLKTLLEYDSEGFSKKINLKFTLPSIGTFSLKNYDWTYSIKDMIAKINDTFPIVELDPFSITFDIDLINYAFRSIIIKKLIDYDFSYSFTLKDFFKSKSYIPIENGIHFLNDDPISKTRIYLENDEIKKWYYIYDRTLGNPNNSLNDSLPTFGKDKKIIIDYNSDPEKNAVNEGDINIISSSSDIPLYQIKAENTDFPYGKVIDPSKITNEQLSKDELFSKGKYGNGDSENPQEIEVIQRYMLTDTDTESYYIIEGILTDKNTQTDVVPKNNGAGSSAPGGGYYRMPHALGATKVFLSLVVDIVSKLIPQILKLISLFKNPGSFIIEIIKEKLGDGFSIFSKEAFKTFEKAKSIKDDKVSEAKSTANGKVDSATSTATDKVGGDTSKGNSKVDGATSATNDKVGDLNNKANGASEKTSDKVNKLKDTFKNSPLSNHVFVDKKGNYKFLLDGLAMLPFAIFGVNLPFGAELNFDKIPSSPIKLIMDAKLSKVKNMQDFLMPKIKDFKGPGSTGVAPTTAGKLAPGLNISDIKTMDSPIYKSNSKIKNDTDAVDIKYSTGEFINGVNYNYIYIDQDVNKTLTDANEILNTPNESVDLEKAKKTTEDLNDALKKDPTNTALKDALNKLKAKLGSLADNTQPLIKMLLGMVTIPIKIIGGIIEWLMKFFKGLTNPLTLPAKIVELLSFSWIMDIMSPIGLMKLIGIKFKPEKLAEWCALTKVPNAKVPSVPNVPTPNVPNIPNPKVPQVPGVETPKLPGVPQVPDFDLKALQYYKDASPKGKFLVPDDHDIADLNEFFSAPFIPKLPTYTARQFRENCTRPLKLVLPTLCFFEKIINGIIDFIWSTLGIEALIPPPHIKLCSKSVDPDINDAIKLANDMNKTNSEPVKTGGTFSNGNNGSVPTDADFLYDITLDNGEVIKGLNYEQMQKYVKDHENVGYDFKF